VQLYGHTIDRRSEERGERKAGTRKEGKWRGRKKGGGERKCKEAKVK